MPLPAHKTVTVPLALATADFVLLAITLLTQECSAMALLALLMLTVLQRPVLEEVAHSVITLALQLSSVTEILVPKMLSVFQLHAPKVHVPIVTPLQLQPIFVMQQLALQIRSVSQVLA